MERDPKDPGTGTAATGMMIPPDLLMQAYERGWFPMAHEDGELYWHDPDPRAVFPLHDLRPDPRTERHLHSTGIQITLDQCFDQVIRACAAREEAWIDARIISSYCELHRLGHAHSLEVWKAGTLVGGIYGVAAGGAFFGESMFNNRNNMGRVAFHGLVRHLRKQGFILFDSQYINPFTEQLGAIEVDRAAYLKTLEQALALSVVFK
jgi:leucyl/phenylalanyl-tRNA---protein transferase